MGTSVIYDNWSINGKAPPGNLPDYLALTEKQSKKDFHEFLFVYKGKIKEKKEYHGIDNDDQDITWESLKIINELKPSIFSELAGFKNKNHIIHLVNTD